MPSALASLRPDPARGVMETMLIRAGHPVELEAHLDRLAQSVAELFGGVLPTVARQTALEGAGPLELGRLRLTVRPRPGGSLSVDGLAARVDPEEVFPSWERAVALCPRTVPGGLGSHKWADRSGLAELERDLPSGSVALLLDQMGEVLEASRANVFAVLAGEVLVTPPADGRILPGLARARAIAAAASLGVQVREQELTLDALSHAAGSFLTGSVRGVEPVRAVGDMELAPPTKLALAIAAEMGRAFGRSANRPNAPGSTIASS